MFLRLEKVRKGSEKRQKARLGHEGSEKRAQDYDYE